MESGSLGCRSLGGSRPAVVAKVSYFRDEGSTDAVFHIKPLGARAEDRQDCARVMHDEPVIERRHVQPVERRETPAGIARHAVVTGASALRHEHTLTSE